MTAENTNDFTIIHGSEFGLPCNLKCGPGLRPHGTICFENRRNNTDDYDSSHELCISVKQKPELRVAEGQGVLKQESLDRILKFVSDNRDTIKDYLGGFTTAKGFLRALRKEHELKEKIINWKRQVFVQYDIPLYVSYWDKDYCIEYKSKFGLLKYGLHCPFMMPKIYTEEEIIQICKNQWPYFHMAENYIEKNMDTLEEEIRILNYYESSSRLSPAQEWVENNVGEEKIRLIIQNYLISQ